MSNVSNFNCSARKRRVVRKKATVVTNKKKEPHIVFKSFNFFDSVVTKIKLLEVDQGGKARHHSDAVALVGEQTKNESTHPAKCGTHSPAG